MSLQNETCGMCKRENYCTILNDVKIKLGNFLFPTCAFQ